MAATTGFGNLSSRSNPACASRERRSASAALPTSRSISILAPATKPSFLPLATTTAFTAGSLSRASSTSPNSAPVSRDSVLTGSPGTSIRTTATPSRFSIRKFFHSVVVMSGLRTVEDDRGAESAGGADGEERVAPLAARQLAERLGDHADAGGAEGMAERDRPAVRIETRRVDLAERLAPAE